MYYVNLPSFFRFLMSASCHSHKDTSSWKAKAASIRERRKEGLMYNPCSDLFLRLAHSGHSGKAANGPTILASQL